MIGIIFVKARLRLKLMVLLEKVLLEEHNTIFSGSKMDIYTKTFSGTKPMLQGVWFHNSWACPLILSYWKEIADEIMKIFGIEIDCSFVTPE